MVRLSQESIDRIVSRVPGGARNVQDIYPLAPQQEGILFHHLRERDSDPYLTAALMRFDSPERLGNYLESLQSVIARHDILRTAVQWEGLPEPVQVIWRRAPVLVEEVNFETAGFDAAHELRERFAAGHFRLDITRAPLMRWYVARDSVSPRRVVLVLHHHLAMDQVTMEVLHEEIHAHLSGRADHLPPAVPYRNFVAKARQGVGPDEHRTFFQQLLGDVDEGTIPFGLTQARGVRLNARLRLEPELTQQLRQEARAARVSVACLCHVAWALVLSRTSSRDDVVFGTVLLGRMQGMAGAGRVLGMLINTLPVRVHLGLESVDSVLKRTHELLTGLMRHEHASLALAQRCSAVAAPAPLFTALLDYRHNSMNRQDRSAARELEGVELLGGMGRTNYPVSMVVDDSGGDIEIIAQVAKPVAASTVCELMQKVLQELVSSLRDAPMRPIRDLDVLPAGERHRLLTEWSKTEIVDPEGELLHELVEERARRNPDAVAAVYGDVELSYRDLNEQANRLGRHLRRLGVGPDKRVAICVERGLEMLVGLLAILKAGGAYVPLDPSYPVERLSHMLSDSKSELILVHPGLPDLIRAKVAKSATLPVVDVVADANRWRGEPKSNLGRGNGLQPDHLAYVIYTSGSTGAPRGVAISHRSVVHSTLARDAYYAAPIRRFLLVSSFGFDSSVAVIFWTLNQGGALVLPSSDDSRNVQALAVLLVERDIDHVLSTPGFLQQVFALVRPGGLPHLKVAVTAGEPCPADLIDAGLDASPALSLYNEYGPTEAAVWATVWSSREGIAGQVPIGRPIRNARVYVVDAEMRPVPTGVVGELLLGGTGLARGYLGRAALTAERFIPDPFSETIGARLYRTGDLVRFRSDGQLEFVGRKDFQVKLRGFRIELGEIEAGLREHPDLKEAVVQVREDGRRSKQLVAYYVQARRDVAEPDASALQAHLAERLPNYMVPSAYVRLDSLPRTVNGKVDRQALPNPERGAYGGAGEYEAPVGDVEQALAGIWQNLLGVERVGRTDDFFSLGGHSILVIALIEQMRQTLGAQVGVTEVYQSPTLAGLTARIREGAAANGRVDLLQEAALDDAIRPRRGPRAIPARTVLLTGCTGFVGRFLLAQLLEETDATVYCLVRAATVQQAAERLHANLSKWDLCSDRPAQRVVVVPGDVRSPRLGLDAAGYANLSRRVDSIYHCATSMNHLEPYATAKPTNVDGARHLLSFATSETPKLINYISTLGVFGEHGGERQRVVDELSPIDHEAHWRSQGYAASKWVSEKLFMTASERGIPCNIFRLGLVWADTQMGRYDELQREYRIIKTCLLSGYGIQDYRYQVAPTPVDYVARATVHLANQHRDGDGIFHISSARQKLDGMFERCNRVVGTSLELLPFRDWVAKIEQLHLMGRTLPAVPLIQPMFAMDGNSLEERRRAREQRATRFDCSRTHRELEQAAIVAPEVDDALLAACVRSMLSRDAELQMIPRVPAATSRREPPSSESLKDSA